MSIKDLKSKLQQLENLLNAKEDIPAQWAIHYVRGSKEFCLGVLGLPFTEEEVLREALELTQQYGTKENYDRASMEGFQNIGHTDLLINFQEPCYFQERVGRCDICECELADTTADFCQKCQDKYPEKIQEIIEYRKQEKEHCGH